MSFDRIVRFSISNDFYNETKGGDVDETKTYIEWNGTQNTKLSFYQGSQCRRLEQNQNSNFQCFRARNRLIEEFVSA